LRVLREPLRHGGLSSSRCAHRRLCALVLWLTLPLAAVQAKAQDSTPSGDSDRWSFGFAPYLWAAGMEGDVATLPPAGPAHVDASFHDILEDLDIAVMGTGEIRRGRFALVADLVYVDLSDDATTPGPFFSRAELDSELFIGTFQASYQVVEGELGHLDLRAGARVWSVTTKLKLDPGLLAGRSRKDTETWVDPVVGFQGRLNLGAGFYVTAMSNIGGFGADSDLTWDTFAGLGYEVNDWFAPVIGYRHLSVDYDKDDFLYDVEMSGPVIGGVIRF
jgi:hypothetical protein